MPESDEKENNEKNELSTRINLENDIFYCPICKQANQKSQETSYCVHCGHEFLVDRNIQLIPKKSSKKKKKGWKLLTGLTISFGTYLIMAVSTIIIMFLLMFTKINTNSILFNFLISISSLLFLIIPIMWIQRYYPGILTIKQRLSELGIPLERYSRKELIREMLLGFLMGLLSFFLVILLQLLSYYLIILIFKVDIYIYLDSIQFEDFLIIIPTNIYDLILFILMMSFLIGVPEEIMFRGFVQRSFENSLSKPAALILTAVYFSLFHIFIYILQPIIFIFLVVPFIGLSILLGLIRNWRGDIIASIVTHFVYNSTQTILIFLILQSI